MPDDRIATVRPIEESEATEKVAAIFADIKATKNLDFVPAFSRHRDQPGEVELVWSTLKTLMHPESVGRAAADSKTREIIALGSRRRRVSVLHQLAHRGPAQTGVGRGCARRGHGDRRPVQHDQFAGQRLSDPAGRPAATGLRIEALDIIGNKEFVTTSTAACDILHAKVVQSTSRFHHRIGDPFLGVPENIFHNAAAFHPSKGVLHFDSDACQLPVRSLLSSGEFPSRWLFFPLTSFLDRRVIPLEAGILVQDGPRRIGNPFRIGDLLVVGLTRVRRAQEADPLPWQSHDDDVLVGVRFLLAAVVQGLFFRAFWPLPPAVLGAVDDEAWLRFGRGLALGKVTGMPLGTNAEIVQGLLEDRQQPMNPIVHLRLAQTKELAHDNLKGISLEVNQNKQELIFWPMQEPLAPPASGTLTGLTFTGLVCRIESLIGLRKDRQQKLKLRESQAG